MSKRIFCVPLCAILRSNILPSTTVPAFLRSSQIQLSSSTSFPFPPSHGIEKLIASRVCGCDSGKSFCSQSEEEAQRRCWNCNATAGTVAFLACEACRSVQPVDQSMDYFQIFGLEKKYDIQVDNLEGKYKDWQKKLHPDLVHTKSEREREYSAEQSSRVIDAYRTLSKSLSRAIYILKLEGVNIDEEQTISEVNLLREIMEIREAVEEAADTQTLTQIQSQILEKLKHWSQFFSNAFQSRRFDEAKTSIQRMTYYERVNEEIMKKL